MQSGYDTMKNKVVMITRSRTRGLEALAYAACQMGAQSLLARNNTLFFMVVVSLCIIGR